MAPTAPTRTTRANSQKGPAHRSLSALLASHSAPSDPHDLQSNQAGAAPPTETGRPPSMGPDQLLGTTSSEAKPKKRRRRRPDHWTPYKKKKKTGSKPAAPTQYSCAYCAEDKPVDQFIKYIAYKRITQNTELEVPRRCIPHLAKSSKKDPTCKTCIGRFFSGRLSDLGAHHIHHGGCLDSKCQEYWPQEFIMKYLPDEDLESYNISMFTAWKARNRDFLVTCVDESCGEIGLLSRLTPGYPQVECNACKLRMCAKCKVPWHKGLACVEHMLKGLPDKVSEHEKQTLELLGQDGIDAKRCPHCLMIVIKEGGCDAMMCGECHHFFDWQTGLAVDLPKTMASKGPETGSMVGCEVEMSKDELKGLL